LVALADRRGPFATVCAARSGTGGWGRSHDEALASDLVRDLAAADAPETVVGQVAEALSSISAAAHGAVVIADENGVEVVEELPDAPRAVMARWALLPSFAPVLEHRQAAIDVIVVLADRTGADLIVRRRDGEPF